MEVANRFLVSRSRLPARALRSGGAGPRDRDPGGGLRAACGASSPILLSEIFVSYKAG
jgi:hypothetical protein